MPNGWNRWIGKNVFVVLNNKRIYTGKVREVHDAGAGIIFISIIDRYEKWVTFQVKEIETIQEEEEGKKGGREKGINS
jgi:hypothetical protein